MKNNLLKSVAAAATASALLFSTVTSFADTTPSATTVTTYSKGTVSVNSTISGVAAGTMVTYLASKKANGTVENSDDILYIGQKTSDGNAITFNYNLPKSVTPTAGNVLAKVKYGANDETTARELNKDTSTEVKYGELTIVKNNCDITVNGAVLTEDTTPSIGNGETVVFGITPNEGYAITEVYLNGTIDNNAPTSGSVSVKYSGTSMELVVICGAVSKDNTNVVKVKDDTNTNTAKEIVCHKFVADQDTNNVTFGVYAKSADNTPYNIDNKTYAKGFYAANFETGTETNYYAVRLEADNLSGITLYPAYLKDNTVTYFDGSKMTIDN